MKRFSEIKESNKIKSKDSIKNQLTDIVEELNIKVSGEETERISNVDINIQGKDEVVEKLKNLIEDIRIQERKNTLNFVKANSFKNFNMKWLNEQIDGLEKVKIGNKFVLNEKLSDTQLGDNYRAALCQYFVNNLNGQNIDGWDFEYHNESGVFEFINSNTGWSVKATPFWNNSDKITIEVHEKSDSVEPHESEPVKFNIEEILYQRYKDIVVNFIAERSDEIQLEKVNEGKVWTKAELDNYVRDLNLGYGEDPELAEMGDAAAFDIANDALEYEEGLKDAINKYIGVADPVGWLANQIA